jgi:hypothetical protein
MRRLTTLGLALALAATLAAQNPPQTPSNLPPPLFRMPDVRKNLNLTPAQVEDLNKLTDATQGRFRPGYQKLENMTPTERAMRAIELNRQYQTAWDQAARDVFNQNQFQRYQQLRWQYGGFNSLADPDLQKRLNMTEDQLRKLNESMEWNRKQWDEMNRMTDRERANRLYLDYQKQQNDRFNHFLNTEQLRTWREMTGEPYSFQLPPATPPSPPPPG